MKVLGSRARMDRDVKDVIRLELACLCRKAKQPTPREMGNEHISIQALMRQYHTGAALTSTGVTII